MVYAQKELWMNTYQRINSDYLGRVFLGNFYFLYFTLPYFLNVFKEHILHTCVNKKEKPKQT